MQLGALHIKDRCSLMIPNLMVALSLHSMLAVGYRCFDATSNEDQ